MRGPPLEGLGPAQLGRTVAVTGAAGYLGAHLSQALLEAGCAVVGIDRGELDLDPRVRAVGLDIRDADGMRAALKGVDTVFHTAAAMSFAGMAPRAVRDRVWSVNADGAQGVALACRAAGVGRLVHVSSANVCVEGEVVDVGEEAPYAQRFVDLYGASKAEGERRVLAASADDLRTLAVRPGGIWGPGYGGYMVRAFLQQLAAGSFVATIGDGRAVVDNTHVFSLIHAMLLGAAALESDPAKVAGRAYFVTDEERLNGIEWFRPIVEGLGRPWPWVRIPGSLAYGLAWVGELGHAMGLAEPVLTRIGVLKLTRSSAFSIDGARRDLGYAPLLGRDAGVALHLDDYRAEYVRLGGR